MTIRTESRTAIDSGVEQVWAYLCDVGRWPEWAPTVRECWVRGGGPLRPGAWVEQRARDLGRSHDRSEQVTVVEAPRALALAGRMGSSVAHWGMELEPVDDGRTDALMWIEVDLAGVMRAAPGLFGGSLQRVSDREMAAIKAAVEATATRECERLITIYRKKAKHYDLTSRLYPAPGYPQRAQRVRAVRALGLRPGDTVIDIACGTGLNFPLLEEEIGPDGRIVGVDLTDAMLERAQERIGANGWRNVHLVHADAADFDFPARSDAILSTYALSQVRDCGAVVAHGAAALSDGGRWVVLDLKVPDSAPGWLAPLGSAVVRPFAALDTWMMRRPWDTIRAAMQEELADLSWTELAFGTAFLAAGTRDP